MEYIMVGFMQVTINGGMGLGMEYGVHIRGWQVIYRALARFITGWDAYWPVCMIGRVMIFRVMKS